jgi:signal transduction histidine kinase
MVRFHRLLATGRWRVPRFVRLDEGRSRDAGGAGLGLAITREIVTAHGGCVEVLDTPPGAAHPPGSTVRISLPDRPVTRSAGRAAQS